MPEGSWPEEGELVICSVDTVKDFVAFVHLDEYGGRQGLIPISEVAKGWVKYIRDFVREGQKVVCKVLHVDRERGHIDLSLRDVNEHQRREKIQEWKNEQKAHKWIGFVAEATATDRRLIEEALWKEYGLLYRAFEDAAIEGIEGLGKVSLEGAVKDAILKVAQENIRKPRVTITGLLHLTSQKPDGVNIIKKALKGAQSKIPDVDIEVLYVGAPVYRIKVTAPDYKTAEKAIEKAADSAIKSMEKTGDQGRFVRKQKAG
ncbi:MAG: translation initiation factor IF-2 subunit alpha [Methanomicrobiales archaeon]|nr:translation initiation factor IF-2 subunit alpha [Methanomicrobiales archaeon]MDD1655204.1 translation initiation factor IF-2 subunit alpha [Methanomicrobiales archaeon]